MITKSKFALVAAIAAMGMAMPALAQSYPVTQNGGAYPGDFANHLPYTADSAPYHPMQSSGRAASGRNAFAYAPSGTVWDSNADTGGGSLGYNEGEADALINR